MNEPKPGFYYHYKNPDKLYFVLGCATNRTTGEREVVYLACYYDPAVERMHTRTVEEWNTEVDHIQTVGNRLKGVPRFTRIKTPDNFWDDYLEDALGQVMGEYLL